MAKQSYNVSNARIGQFSKKTDHSFASCVCTMLIILLVCVFLLLLAIKFRPSNGEASVAKNESNIPQSAGKNVTSLKFERILQSTTTTTGKDAEETTTLFYKNVDETTTAETENSKKEFAEILETTRATDKNLDAFITTNEEDTRIWKTNVDSHISTTIHENIPELTTVREPDITTSTTENLKEATETPKIHTQSSSNPSLDFNSLLVKDTNTCNTTYCDVTAAKIMLSMDFSKSPCENFYDYACGGFLIGEGNEEFDVFDPAFLSANDQPEFVKKFKIFHRSCLKHEDRFEYEKRIEKAKLLLSNIGSFQFDGQKNTTYNITEFVANLILFKSMPLFDVGIEEDPNYPIYALKLSPPDQTSLDLKHWSTFSETKRKCMREIEEASTFGSYTNLTVLYQLYRNCQRNYSDYLDAIETSVRELGFFENLTRTEINKHVRDIRVFIEFEILSLLDEMEEPAEIQEKIARKKFEVVKFSDLQEKFPVIEWNKFFSAITFGINSYEDGRDIAFVYNKKYFEKIFKKLSKLNQGKLNNAFLAILALSLFENTVLPSHRHSRIEFCKKTTKELMPDIVNYLHKLRIPTGEAEEQKEYIRNLYENLRSRFNQSINEAEWLNDESRESIREKLENIKLAIFSTEDKVEENLALEKDYTGLTLELGDYQSNLFNLMEFRRRRLFSMEAVNVTKENLFRYFVDASKDEPVYSYANDIVCIPYGLVKKIKKDLPGYITMAQVGFPLAKIIGHAFDSVGMKFRVDLSENSDVSFSNFADQTRDVIVLSNPIIFENHEYSFSLNKALSEPERMAENTALRLLTESFNTFGNHSLLPWISFQFSREKIFFLSIAQEFCRKMSLMEFVLVAHEGSILPPQFRIENILENSGEFLNQFNCRPGSAMTRIEDRLQFPYLVEVSKEEVDY